MALLPSASNKFFMPTDDVLGFKYQEYVSAVRALAISSPDQYFTLRRAVLKSVKTDAVSKLYETIFNVLSEGKNLAGNPIDAKMGSGIYVPGYPSQKINDFAIEVASDLADHLNRVVDILLPDDFEKLASGKLNLRARASTIAPAAAAAIA